MDICALDSPLFMRFLFIKVFAYAQNTTEANLNEKATEYVPKLCSLVPARNLHPCLECRAQRDALLRLKKTVELIRNLCSKTKSFWSGLWKISPFPKRMNH